MSVPFIILAAAVIFFVWRSYKKKNQSGEAAAASSGNGTTVTGPRTGQSYVVPNKLRKAYKNYESSPMESVYGLLCARQTADLGYAAFKRDRANLPADANTPYMDADLFSTPAISQLWPTRWDTTASTQGMLPNPSITMKSCWRSAWMS